MRKLWKKMYCHPKAFSYKVITSMLPCSKVWSNWHTSTVIERRWSTIQLSEWLLEFIFEWKHLKKVFLHLPAANSMHHTWIPNQSRLAGKWVWKAVLQQRLPAEARGRGEQASVGDSCELAATTTTCKWKTTEQQSGARSSVDGGPSAGLYRSM